MSSEYDRRRHLTFAQSEGAAPLPAQLDREYVSPDLRAKIWAVFYQTVMAERFREGTMPSRYRYRLNSRWHAFWNEKRINFDNILITSTSYNDDHFIADLYRSFTSSDYVVFYGIIQFILRSKNVSVELKREFDSILAECRSAYRVVEGDTLVPFASEHELKAFENAGSALSRLQSSAPLAHLNRSASFLGDGKFADSVRESISAIESIVRNIDPSNNVSVALNQLSRSRHIHQSMNEAFKKLYGYASDEQGIRHALLDDGDAKVTEADAMFMLGACSAFATYLTINARSAGLIKSGG